MIRPMLRMGSSGAPVALLQKALNLASAPPLLLVEDGLFGPKTHGCVCRFQSSQNLAPDGIAGPKTHSALEETYATLAKLVENYIIPPADEAAARQRIVDIANAEKAAFGWLPSAVPPGPFSQRIATRYMIDPVSRARQGGLHLSMLYSLAGMSTNNCLNIRPTRFGKDGNLHAPPEEKKYGLAANDSSPLDDAAYKRVRNVHDLNNWCGVFALSVWKSAGLKNLPAFPSKPFLPANGVVQAIGPKDVKPGDIGIVEPQGGRNHHFIVTSIEGNEFHSVDGNAGDYYSIFARMYRVTNPNSTGPGPHTVQAIPSAFGAEKAYFVTPVWSKVK